MHGFKGAQLLQMVAERIIARYLADEGMDDVSVVSLSRRNGHGDGVDLTYGRMGRTVRAKVKADPYFGSDPDLEGDLDLAFYRPDSGNYALEVVAHHVTREPGWVFRSDADELFYYLLVLEHSEDEVDALLRESDQVLFGELRVGRDDLRIMPMRSLCDWFTDRHELYSTRPVRMGDHLAWYRLVPRDELDKAVPGIAHIGSLMARIKP